MTAASVPATPASKSYRYLVVIVLAVVYTFNFMDRQIMSILQEPIRKELSLSDTQLGMLTGLAFALFYTTFGVLLAWAADRYKRVLIMAHPARCGACSPRFAAWPRTSFSWRSPAWSWALVRRVVRRPPTP